MRLINLHDVRQAAKYELDEEEKNIRRVLIEIYKKRLRRKPWFPWLPFRVIVVRRDEV